MGWACGADIWVRFAPNTCICTAPFPRLRPPTELMTPGFGWTCGNQPIYIWAMTLVHLWGGWGRNVVIITCVGCVRLTGVTVWFTIVPADPWAPENICNSLEAEKVNRSNQTGNDGTPEKSWHLHYNTVQPVAGVVTSTDVGCNTEGSWAGVPALSDDAITTLSAGTSCWELNWLVAWGWAGCLACSRMLCWALKHISCLTHTVF